MDDDEFDLSLNVKFSIPLNEDLSEQIFTKEIEVEISAESNGLGEGPYQLVKLGEASFVLLDIYKADDEGVARDDLAFNLDAIEADIGGFALEVLPSLEDIEKIYLDVPIGKVLLLKSIKIAPPYRGQGIGSKAITAMIRSDLFACDLIVVKPFGVEEEKIYEDDSPGVKKRKCASLKVAELKLRKFYERLGFRSLLPEHMTYSTAIQKQPTRAHANKFREMYKKTQREMDGQSFSKYPR